MFEEKLSLVLEQIKNGNNLGEKVFLVGATKTVDVETINHAIDLGLTIVAENKVQEFNLKHQLISKKASQHFIGHLQTNKVKYVVGKVDLIHSVDSFHLAESISKQAQKLNLTQDILVEINVGGELSKSGISPENAVSEIEKIKSLPNIKVCGVMAMLIKTDDRQLLIELCKRMREIFEKLQKADQNIRYLSMGMSEDYEIAIQNGSNMIRVGSLIFGKRNNNLDNKTI